MAGPSTTLRSLPFVLALGIAPAALSAPLVHLKIEGRPAGTNQPFASTVFVANGQSVEYRMLASVAPVGTSNTEGDLTRKITSLVPGTDGISGISVGISQQPGNGQVPLDLTPVVLDVDWSDIPGASSGTPAPRPGGGIDLRKIQAGGEHVTFAALSPEEVFRGTVVVPVLALPNGDDFFPFGIDLRLNLDETIGVVRFNGGATSVFLRQSNILGADPTISTGVPLLILPGGGGFIPEPGAGMSAVVASIALFVRRRRRRP
jgi:hypothetical protein